MEFLYVWNIDREMGYALNRWPIEKLAYSIIAER